MSDNRNFSKEKSQVIAAQALRVRTLQKAYFKTRNVKVLQESKQAEKELDKMLSDYFDEDKQETLF